MNIRELTSFLEELAPITSQEAYDNSGLIVGHPDDEVQQALICLDCTEEIIQEAIDHKCQIVIAHHPIIFRGMKKLNGTDYVQRTVMKAIKNDIAIYAVHTNLDNYRFGVNAEIGRRLGLQNLKVLSPKREVLNKVVVYVPATHKEEVFSAMFEAGAGRIGDYEECGFSVAGEGTFKPMDAANPFIGKAGERSAVNEVRAEVMVSSHVLGRVIRSMKNAHPYEEVAYEVYDVRNEHPYEGSGMIGELEEGMESGAFLSMVKEVFHCGCIRHTAPLNKPIKSVAFCGGAGSFLLRDAKRSGADVFITADYKYHEFFEAEEQIMIADIGHYESEQYTSDLLSELLTKKFPKFAVRLTAVNTNPINYF